MLPFPANPASRSGKLRKSDFVVVWAPALSGVTLAVTFYASIKTAASEYLQYVNRFGPPGNITDRERRSLYDQRSCHFASDLYQRCAGCQELFWNRTRSVSSMKWPSAKGVSPLQRSTNSCAPLRRCCGCFMQDVSFLTHRPLLVGPILTHTTPDLPD